MSSHEHRFDAAINPYGCSPKVVEAMVAHARSKAYRFYGEPWANSLRERLAERFNLTPEHFLVYNGAGEALVWHFLARLLLPRGRLLTPYPSYERFVEAGRRCAAEVVEVPLSDEAFSLPVDAMIETARARQVAAALISSPNNPTGNRLVDVDTLGRLLKGVPDCLWIVDEAYADYTGTTLVPMVRNYPNLVVLRTFSKAYGLAGLRVGYSVAHPQVSSRLAALQIPWGVDSMALVAAEAALEDEAYVQQVVARIQRDRTDFAEALSQFPFLRVHPSDANFFLVRLDGIDPASFVEYLSARQIRVRRRPDMPHHVRITCMTPPENQMLFEALEGFQRR
jgi:histidinol-phosphate aminotransferase